MAKADICLLLEGTYPYVSGGVSSWTHELISMQDHLTFAIVSLLPPGAPVTMHYNMPKNVVELRTVFLQQLPKGQAKLPKLNHAETEAWFGALEEALIPFFSKPNMADLGQIIRLLEPYREVVGQELLMDSEYAWKMVQRMYQAVIPNGAFLDFFWSWRAIMGSVFSVLLAKLPEADAYHSLCTGYAGLMLSRASAETDKPCLLTEHGIYTNERRIEIALAPWLNDSKAMDLSVLSSGMADSVANMELKDFWIKSFSGYSQLSYEASQRIVTLFEGNQMVQRMDGAPEHKLQVIPNGIEMERFAAIRPMDNHPPTIALIGRVVPIKDIKTFIRAVHILKAKIPALVALVIGPMDEDPAYAEECMDMVRHIGLEDTLSFTGKVNILDYLPRIDVHVLTSISEAQPLTILEVGAAGIPTVASDVGACREMILGKKDETPAFGPGGAVAPLANPIAIAEAVHRLLADTSYHQQCSDAIRARVGKYYYKQGQYQAYRTLYGEICKRQEKEAA